MRVANMVPDMQYAMQPVSYTHLDVYKRQSVGDAKSIEGGVLLMTALRAANGEIYAEAQGPLVIGGYSEGASGNLKSVNHPTVGRIAEGGIVERLSLIHI